MRTRTSLAAALALLLVLGAPRAAPRAATMHVFQFRLTGAEVVPPVNSDGVATCTVTLDDATGAYTVVGDYTCLEDSITQVHFHGPAGIGQEAPILVAFGNTGGTSGTFSHTGVLGPQLVQDMLNGLVYVQLHTLFRITGELRGQVLPCSTAAVSVRNGAGVNALLLSSPAAPVMNATWNALLDCTGHAPGAAVLFAYARPSSGTMIGAGEVLVRTSGKRLLQTARPHAGDVITFSAAVPDDPALCGLSAHAQALVLGSPGPRLSNALHLILGR